MHDFHAAVQAVGTGPGLVGRKFQTEYGAGDVFALMGRGVGKEHLAVDIADGPGIRRRLQIIVRRDEAAPVKRAARVFRVQVLGVRHAPGSDESLFGCVGCAVSQCESRVAVLVLLQRLGAHAHKAEDAVLLQRVSEMGCNIFILCGGELRGCLGDDDVCPHMIVEIGHLDADRAAAGDNEAFGHNILLEK